MKTIFWGAGELQAVAILLVERPQQNERCVPNNAISVQKWTQITDTGNLPPPRTTRKENVTNALIVTMNTSWKSQFETLIWIVHFKYWQWRGFVHQKPFQVCTMRSRLVWPSWGPCLPLHMLWVCTNFMEVTVPWVWAKSSKGTLVGQTKRLEKRKHEPVLLCLAFCAKCK